MRKLSIVITLLLLSIIGYTQNTGTVTGKILDKSNNALRGVTIAVNGVDKTTTDVDGRYTIVLAEGNYEFKFTSTGYTESVEKVTIKKGVIIDLDIILEIKKKKEDDVTVRAAPSGGRKETVNAGIQFQKNTNTVASIITAESIKRSPDRNTGEVLKRTPGASIQEGKFLVIRGLADRYNQAMLNGILLTSTEPDRKTFSFDIIPSAMVDNLVINKAFVPEYPGEWAGGLIQVNTKDIPNKNFFNIQIGSGFNTQTIGRTFYEDKGGKTDWLGIDDGTRGLPSGYVRKAAFDTTNISVKTAIGKTMRNAWAPTAITAPLNASFQINGGFTGKLFGKKIGGILSLNYNKNNKYLDLLNRLNTLSGNTFSINTNLDDDRYQQDVQLGALASFTIQFNNSNKVSIKTITNVNTSNQTTIRNGYDVVRGEDLQGAEFTFRQNTFFTTQLNGDHSISKNLKLRWYGAFNILDGYTPDQRRILYTRAIGTNNPYNLLLGSTLSQQSGSRIFQFLNDYIYTGGGDVTYTLKNKQTLKAGYMLQIRDRLYDANLFANFLNTDNAALRSLSSDRVFAPENFGNGTDNKFGFNAIKGNTFRYMANTILNAGYIQMDNEFFNKLRVVWGVRIEHFDQLVGSVKTWDPRHTYSKVLDVLPGLNATLKANTKTNIRFSASQTVIRPELRELASLNLYDFELNASIQGNPLLKRTKVTNLDLRYEFYNKPGEVFTVGLFYKNFKNPIEQLFNEGIGGASTFNYQNPESAYSTGLEIEFRKKLDVISNSLKNFTFQANGAIIQSKVEDSRFNLDRPLQGQSPYLINVGILFDEQKHNISSTLLFNVIGQRIFLVGDVAAGAGSPNIWEAPRPVLDYQITKKILKKKAEIRMNVSDILNMKQYFYQNAEGKDSFQKNNDAFRFTRRFGTTFNFTFNYTL